MIQIKVRTDAGRQTIIAESTATIRNTLEENNIEYSGNGYVCNLDGKILKAGEFDKTFEEFGIESECNLFVIVKADGAAR